MTEYILFAALFLALIICYAVLFWLERRDNRRVEHLYACVAKLSVNQEHIQNDHTKLMTAEQTAEERIAERMEKKWNKGLENMMAYNPFIKQDAGDDE